MAESTLKPFQGFPDFRQTVPGFPYGNAVEQLMASMGQPARGNYARFAGGGAPRVPGATPQAGGMLSMPDPGSMGPPLQVANGEQWGAPGSVPTSFTGHGTTPFSTAFAGPPPGQGSTFGNLVRSNLSAYGPAGQAYANMPKSFTVDQFNSVAPRNAAFAQDMLAAGGQQFRNAVMQANGWDNATMNAFINAANYGDLGGTRGFTKANLGMLGL